MGSHSRYRICFLVLFSLHLLVAAGCNDEPTSPSPPTPPQPEPPDAEPASSEPTHQPPPASVSKTTSDYTFIVDGKVIEATYYSLTKLDAEPQAGDIAHYGWATILGKPGIIRLKRTSRRDGRTLRVGPNGEETLYGFAYRRNIVDDDTGDTKTTFDSIELSQLRHARSVFIDEWGAEAAKILRNIDPTRTCVTFSQDALAAETNLPPLPRKLRCLVIGWVGSPNLSGLGALQELRFLKIHGDYSGSFDGRWLAKNTELRHLIIQAPIELSHPESLEVLEELISLDMSGSRNIDSIGFVEKLRSLRRLDISLTKVTDLSPIAKAVSLEEVRADITPVDTLPHSEVPNLRELHIVSTKLDDRSVARFRKLNPSCEIWHRPGDALETATKDVTRMRVRWGGVCHRDPEREETIAVVDDRAAVRDFLSHIAFEKDGGGACACCGRLTFELYREQELAVALSLHHGKRLRWLDGWPNDETLTDDSRVYLGKWLAKRGVAPLEETPQ